MPDRIPAERWLRYKLAAARIPARQIDAHLEALLDHLFKANVNDQWLRQLHIEDDLERHYGKKITEYLEMTQKGKMAIRSSRKFDTPKAMRKEIGKRFSAN